MLNEAFDERIVLLVEESSEVIQESTKILRFGFDEYHPVTMDKNQERLHKEVADVLFCVALMVHEGDLELDKLNQFVNEKKRKFEKFTRQNQTCLSSMGEIELGVIINER